MTHYYSSSIMCPLCAFAVPAYTRSWNSLSKIWWKCCSWSWCWLSVDAHYMIQISSSLPWALASLARAIRNAPSKYVGHYFRRIRTYIFISACYPSIKLLWRFYFVVWEECLWNGSINGEKGEFEILKITLVSLSNLFIVCYY